MNPGTLIIGASSEIAKAIFQQLQRQSEDRLICISRKEAPEQFIDSELVWLVSDYSEGSLQRLLPQLRAQAVVWERVIICNGVLHDDKLFPEKKMKEVSAAKLQSSMLYNAIIPFLWLQLLQALLPRQQNCKVAVFSARVGSIEDNRLGGWYSYRAAKAALNMLIKTASMEFRRSHPHVSLLAFHPGTTATPLSGPFQQGVPPHKLFTPDFVAQQLLSIMAQDFDSPAYVDWAGQPIPW